MHVTIPNIGVLVVTLISPVVACIYCWVCVWLQVYMVTFLRVHGCVCACACMVVCVPVHDCMCACTWMRVCVYCTWVYVCACLWLRVCVYMVVCVHGHGCVCACAWLRVCMYSLGLKFACQQIRLRQENFGNSEKLRSQTYDTISPTRCSGGGGITPTPLLLYAKNSFNLYQTTNNSAKCYLKSKLTRPIFAHH